MKIYVGLAVFLGFLLCFVPAEAQKIRDQYIKPMPKIELLPEAEFKNKTQFIDRPSEKDPLVGYEIRIPKDWKILPDSSQEQDLSGGNILGEIGKFVSPSGMDEPSFIQIHALSLDHQISIEQWFLQYLVKNRYNSEGLKIYNETCAEALYAVVKGSLSYIVRAVACINGKRVIFLEYYMPIENWETEKVTQAQVLNSFRLKKMVRAYVENFKSTKILDVVSVRYPESWRLKNFPIGSVDRMQLQLLNITTVPGEYDLKSRLDGKIDIHFVAVSSSEGLEQEIEKIKEYLKTEGLEVGEQIEKSLDLIVNPKLEFADTNVYNVYRSKNVSKKLIDYEFWMTAISAGEYYYLVPLLTPSRDQDYESWVQNTQAYKIVLDLIEPNPEKIEPADAPQNQQE